MSGGPSSIDHTLMGDDFERSRYVRILSVFVHSMFVHEGECDMKISLQVRHTWVNAIKASSPSTPKESRMRVRTSGGIWLIGASLFFKDRARRRTSKRFRSRPSTWDTK